MQHRPIFPGRNRMRTTCPASLFFVTAFFLACAWAFPDQLAAQLTPPDQHAHEHEHDDRGHDAVEEIVTTASPLDHQRDELAIPVTYMDRDDIVSSLGSTLGETLRFEPGITTTSFAPGASRPIVRGQGAFRVRVLEDGMGLGDVSDLSADHGIPVNPLVAERIEVLRGPATLRYGGGAIGGVVNTITDRIPRREEDSALRGGLYAGYAFNGSGRNIAARLDGGIQRLTWHVDGLFRDSGDYDIPSTPGRQSSTFTETDGFSSAATYNADSGRIGLAYSRTNNEYGIPAPEDPANPAHIDMNNDRFHIDGAWMPNVTGIREIRVRNTYSDYEHEEITRLDGTAATFKNREWEGRAEILHEPLGSFLGAVGLHWRSKHFSAGGEASELLAPSDTNTVAAYFFEEFPLTTNASLELGARVEHTRVDGITAAGSRRELDYVPLSASASLQVAAAPDHTVGITVSAAERAPSTLELFAKGPHEATGTFERGDTTLDEETSIALDLNARGDFAGRFAYDAGLFYTRYFDYVFGRLTGRTCAEDGTCVAGAGEELDELVYETADAKFYGAELAARADMFDIADGVAGVEGQFDWVRAEFIHGGNVPRIPPIRWGLGLFYEGDHVRGDAGFLRHETQNDISDTETRTDAFTMLHANVSIRTDLSGGRVPVEWTVSADNLLDEKARNHVSFLKNDVLLPGRSVRVGMRVEF